MLTRLMMKFGTPEPRGAHGGRRRPPARRRRRASRRTPTARYKLVVDDQFDRAWRRVGLALDRIGFTVVDRDRSSGVYFVRYGDPDTRQERHREHLVASCSSGRPTTRTSPSSTGSWSPRPTPSSVVSVQDPDGAPDKSRDEREDPRAAQGPAQVARRRVRFASLGSGSEGNGLVVEAGGTRVLIDCGFGVRDTAARLARLGLAPESLDAILVTHEHADHVGGVPAFAARYGIPVWLTFGTLDRSSASASTACAHVYGFDSHDRVRDRRPRGAAVPGAARRARAGAVRGRPTARGASAC